MTSIHALVIDDNSKNRSVISYLLSAEGVTHTSVPKPTELEPTIQNVRKFDVVFLDLEMPGLDGYQVFGLLRSDARFQSVPIVACTVHTSEMPTAHEMGFDGFLAKPLDADRFPAQLARILNGEGVWEAA